MEIFEITQPRKPVNEVLGKVAAGIGRAAADKFMQNALPGVNLDGETDKELSQALRVQAMLNPQLAKQRTQSTTTTQPTTAPAPAPAAQKFPAFGTAIPQQPAPAPTQPAAQPAAQPAPAPAAGQWQGQNINVPAVLRKQAAQAAQPAAAPAKPAVPATAAPAATPAVAPTTGVTPRPGHRIVVAHPRGGKYYKTEKGWTNELGQLITKPASVAELERRADAGGREEQIPGAVTKQPARPIQPKRRAKRTK